MPGDGFGSSSGNGCGVRCSLMECRHSSQPTSFVSITIVSSLAAGSARTLPDGSSTELPEEKPTGVVGVTAGRSEAKEAGGLDTHQGQRPCPSTILLEGEPQAEALEPEDRPEAGWWFTVREVWPAPSGRSWPQARS